MTERNWLLTETAGDGYLHAVPKTGGKTLCGQVATFPVGGDGYPSCAGCKHETTTAERNAARRRKGDA